MRLSDKERNDRATHAVLHTKEMEEKYSAEIEKAYVNTMTYTGFPNGYFSESAKYMRAFTPYTKKKNNTAQEFFLRKMTSTQAVINSTNKVAVLNFASYKNPGGQFYRGSKAQEEDLCHDSYLYNVLRRFESTYYAKNREDLNKGMYNDRALISPDIRFFSDGVESYADVITCAAPNKIACVRYNAFTEEENFEALKQRAKFLAEIADAGTKASEMIIGAWGCGVFMQNIYQVFAVLLDEFNKTHFDTITFAVPDGKTYQKVDSIIKGDF